MTSPMDQECENWPPLAKRLWQLIIRRLAQRSHGFSATLTPGEAYDDCRSRKEKKPATSRFKIVKRKRTTHHGKKSKYEDVCEDELESIINLSSCKVIKDKKGRFNGHTCRIFATNSSTFPIQEKSCGQKRTFERGVKTRAMSSWTDRMEDTNVLADKRKFATFADMSSCVASFLEVSVSEPSDADTLSSTFSDSYETIQSDYDAVTIGSDSLEECNSKHADDNEVQENIYDEIDGNRMDEVTDVTRDGLPVPSREPADREHYNMKMPARIIDETFVIEDHVKSHDRHVTNKASYREMERLNPNVVIPDEKKYLRKQGIECNNNSSTENYNIEQRASNQTETSPVYKSSSSSRPGRRVSTQVTPFNNSDRQEKTSDQKQQSLRKHNYTERNEHTSEQKLNRLDSLNNEFRDGNYEDVYTETGESNFFSLEDSLYPEDKANQCNNLQKRILQEVDKIDTPGHVYGRRRLHVPLQRNNVDLLNKQFSPTHETKMVNNFSSDLSPGYRSRATPQFVKRLDTPKSEFRSLHRDYDETGSPHAKSQAQQHKKTTPQNGTIGIVNFTNETEHKTVYEGNTSLKKDSGVSTLHDESLIIESLMSGELPQVPTLENLERFNKSLAEQSTFIDVSVNCSGKEIDVKYEQVDKWLHNVSVEMEKDLDTTIDRKVNKMCTAVQYKDINKDAMFNGSRINRFETNREGHKSAEIEKEANDILHGMFAGKSCQPLQQSPRIVGSNDIGCRGPIITECVRNGERRQLLRGHRSLTPLPMFQRLKDQQIAELMRTCGKSMLDASEQEQIPRRRNLEFIGKRFMNYSNEAIEGDYRMDVVPKPPKSRRLSENISGHFNHSKLGEGETGSRLGELKQDIENDIPSHRRKDDLYENYTEPDHSNNIGQASEKEGLMYMNGCDVMQRDLHDSRGKHKHIRHKDNRDIHNRFLAKEEMSAERIKHRNRCKPSETVYHEVENGCEYGERNTHEEFARQWLQNEKKSPDSRLRTSDNSEHKTGQRDSGKVRICDPQVFGSNQYQVNQSYIRRLKPNQTSQIEREIEDQSKNVNYVEIGHDKNDMYERQNNIENAVVVVLEQSPRTNNKHKNSKSYHRIENGRPESGNPVEADKRNTIFERQNRFDEVYAFVGEKSPRISDINRQSSETTDKSRPGNGCYIEIEKDNGYETIGKFDDDCQLGLEQCLGISNRHQQSGHATERDKLKSGHSDEVENDILHGRFGLFDEECSLYSDQTPCNRERYLRSEQLTGRERYVDSRNRGTFEYCGRYEKNRTFDDKSNCPIEQSSSMRCKRHSTGRIEKVFHTVAEYCESEAEVSENDSLLAEMGTQTSHITQCQLRSPHRQMSQIENSNNTRGLRDYKSPNMQRTKKDNNDIEFRPPRYTSSPNNEKFSDFSSSDVQRKKHTSINKEDEFSPSTSLARMRLNTPKSKSDGRQKLHRRSHIREDNLEMDTMNDRRFPDKNLITKKKSNKDNSEMNAMKYHKVAISKISRDGKIRNNSSVEVEVPVEVEEQNVMEVSSESKALPRFISLDQIRGIPLQFRIQQLESGHVIIDEGHIKVKEHNGSFEPNSNDDLSEEFHKYSNRNENNSQYQPAQEINRNVNVYHTYCEAINERCCEQDQAMNQQTSSGNTNQQSRGRAAQMTQTVTNEPKMRKGLFSPPDESKRSTMAQEQKTEKTGLQSAKRFDGFKIPNSPPVIAKDKHNKENEIYADNSPEQKSGCANSEILKASSCVSKKHVTKNGPRDSLVKKHSANSGTTTRDNQANKYSASSGHRKMTLQEYMQSTPIKPGMKYMLNATMSTIMGSDETEVDNEANEEIILI